MTGITPRPFVWYELMSNDPAASGDFYRKVVGWNVKDSGMPGMSYSILSLGEISIGGMLGLTDEMRAGGARPCWIGYVGVADVDADAARIAAAGGKVLRAPADIPGIGRWAMVTDPHGAPFVIFRGTTDASPTPQAPGTPGTMGWHELHAGDGQAAWAFYSSTFGWTAAEAMDMGPMGIYQIFGAGGAPIGGMMTRSPETPGPFWLYYVNVDGTADAVARATGAGAKLLMGPHEVPGPMWVAIFTDPQGATFAVVSAKP